VKDEHVRDEPVKDAAQDVAVDVTQDAAEDVQDLAFGARAARFLLATPPPPSLCSSRSDRGATEQLSGIWLGLGARALPGVPRKAPVC